MQSSHIINVLFSTPKYVSHLWDFDWFDPAASSAPRQAA